MRKRVRYVFVILIALGAFIGIIAAYIHFRAVNEFHDIITSFVNADKLEINLEEYSSKHRRVELVDEAKIEEIRKYISELQYGGLYEGMGAIAPADQAYDLIVSSKYANAIFVISASHEKSYIAGSPFPVSIKNYDGLYDTVNAVFG